MKGTSRACWAKGERGQPFRSMAVFRVGTLVLGFYDGMERVILYDTTDRNIVYPNRL